MATAVRDPYVGTVVGGRYEVRSRIASGGMGTVYRALDTRLDREVALKVMHPHLAADATFVARFSREARAAARLSHPGVVAVFDQGADEGAVYLAMEHVPGATLRDVLAARGALRLREALDVAEEVLAALSAAHTSGLVHRDVKPENILIGSDGRLRIVDFGLARAASATGSATSTLIGTVGYLAPELLSTGSSDARADVYAVGVVLVELLTGRPPFSGSVPAQVAFRHVHEDVPLPSALRPDLPASVDDLVRWSTARVPDQRPADAEELLSAVRRVRAGLGEAELDAPVRLVAGAAVASTLVAERELARPVPTTAGTSAPAPAGPAPTLVVPVPAGPVAAHTALAPPVGPPVDPPVARTAIAPTAIAPSDLAGAGAPARSAAPPAPPAASAGSTVSARSAGSAGSAGSGAGRRRRSRRRGLGLLVAVIMLAALLAAAAGWVFTAGPLGHVRVPGVAGDDVAAARAELARADLHSSPVRRAYSDRYDAGRVVSVAPASGSRVRRGSGVVLVVSRGPHLFTVPSLVGRTRQQAAAALERAGLQVGNVGQDYSETVPAGSVISQQTAPGHQLSARTGVDYTVSQGQRPIDVPGLGGKSEDEARAALATAGLSAGDVSYQSSSDVTAGQVISQSPSSGTLFAHGRVDLVISSGPQMVDVPDVRGQQVDVATKQLQQAGLQVSVDDVFGAPVGQVRQQSPVGTKAPIGSTVTLTVF